MLVRALVALVPVGALAAWSAVTFAWWKTVAAFLQLLGAACLAMVVLTHICEALGLLPWMGWGQPESLGHFVLGELERLARAAGVGRETRDRACPASRIGR